MVMAIFESYLAKGPKFFLRAVAFLILVFVAGTRYETGGDWNVYTTLFKMALPLSEALQAGTFGIDNIEPWYGFLCATVKQLGGNIQWVFFVITLSNIIILMCTLRKYTKRILFGLLVYYAMFYFALDMLYTRQSTSVLLALLAFTYVDDWKDWWKFAIVTILACYCHRMALILLPLYLFSHIKLSDSFVYVVVTLGCILMLFGVQWLSPVFLAICKFLGNGFYNRALLYTSDTHFAVQRGLSIGFLLNLGLFALFMWKRKAIENLPHGRTLFSVFLVSIIVYYYGYELIEVSNRFRFYFFISLVALFPMILDAFEWAVNKYIVASLIIIYLFLFNRGVFLNLPSAIAYQPYQNYIVYTIKEKRSTGKERLEQSIEQTNEQRQQMKRN
jgi:hypothetical protein